MSVPRGSLLVINKALPTGYVTNAYYNGLGRYVCQLQRITFKFCKSYGASRGIREFIETNLIDFARKNPGIVIYLKPRRHRTPVIVTEYLNGERHWLSCHRFTIAEVQMWTEFLRTRSGNNLMQFLNSSYTPIISTQGLWNPFLNRPSHLNIESFPNAERSQYNYNSPSATEQLIQMAKDGGFKNVIVEEENDEFQNK